jgi:hypothetical protein
MQILEKLFQALFLLHRLHVRLGLQYAEDIFLHSQATENGRLLREVTETQAGSRVHGKAGYILGVQVDCPAVTHDQADDHVETRGLSGSVRSQQAHDFAAANAQADVVHHDAGIVAFREAARGQNAHRAIRRLVEVPGAVIFSSV